MKKMLTTFAFLMMVGGLPAAHGAESGRVFGGLVRSLASTNPAALVEHILDVVL
jgi:hypothetical protein